MLEELASEPDSAALKVEVLFEVAHCEIVSGDLVSGAERLRELKGSTNLDEVVSAKIAAVDGWWAFLNGNRFNDDGAGSVHRSSDPGCGSPAQVIRQSAG